MIQIWVLTGDKLETAVNIAYSCGHFKRGMEVKKLSGRNGLEYSEQSLVSLRWIISPKRRRLIDFQIQLNTYLFVLV